MRLITALLLVTALAGCSSKPKLSDQFQSDARFAYNLIKAADSHEYVRKYDVTVAVAKMQASAKTDSEKELAGLIERYITNWRIDDGGKFDAAWLKSCSESIEYQLDLGGIGSTVAKCKKMDDLFVKMTSESLDCPKKDSLPTKECTDKLSDKYLKLIDK